ncbi:MAG: hypothetical protein SPJ29_03015 [Phocaeicola sp.]|nr:hypothetical protein [Prevotellaceae bacterium]MDY5938716.1 hypothetical protein [Phocaeicola sp.]
MRNVTDGFLFIFRIVVDVNFHRGLYKPRHRTYKLRYGIEKKNVGEQGIKQLF